MFENYDPKEINNMFFNVTQKINKMGLKIFNKELKNYSFLLAFTTNKLCKVIKCKNLHLENNQKETDKIMEFLAKREFSDKEDIVSIIFLSYTPSFKEDELDKVIESSGLSFKKKDFGIIVEGGNNSEEFFKISWDYAEKSGSMLSVSGTAFVYNCYGETMGLIFSINEDHEAGLILLESPMVIDDPYSITWKIRDNEKMI